MIIIHVEHFLNDIGKEFFPTFIKEMRKAMKEYNNGYISLRQILNQNSKDETHFLLEYENFELLQEFSKTGSHEKLLNELKKYQLLKQVVEKYHPIEE